METAFLMNVVNNDFKDPEAIFRPFYAAGKQYKDQHSTGPKPNGALTNGVH